MPGLRCRLFLLTFALTLSARAQTVPPPAPPSPAGIYQDLVRSVDDVRNDMANWSDTELAAFAAAVKQAAVQCPELQKSAYEADELLGLARVCALGQNWPSTYSAARRYTQDQNAAQRVDGYGLLLQADLHLQHSHDALDHLTELRGTGPLTEKQDAVFQYSITSLAVADPGYAEAIGLLRQPDLLACMAACRTDLPRAQAEIEAWQDITLVWLNDRTDVHDAANEIEAAASARTTPLNATEAKAVSMAQRQFRLLGQPLPATFNMPRCGPAAPGRKSPATACTTAFLVAPQDAPITPALLRAMEEFDLRLPAGQAGYLVLSGCTGTIKFRSPHTICKPGSILTDLGATGPTLVIADSAGKVAWLSPANAAWLNPNAAASVLLDRIGQRTR